MFTAILPAVLLTAPGADPALEPWASKAQPGDVTKRHVEKIGTAEHKYTVVHGGTMDGTNCRSPMGCGMNREGAIEQTWQSNRAVRMENMGQTDVVDPWLTDGRNNFRNIKEIVASVMELRQRKLEELQFADPSKPVQEPQAVDIAPRQLTLLEPSDSAQALPGPRGKAKV